MSSEVRFGAFFAYAPKGTSEASQRGLRVRDLVKKAHTEFLQRAATRIAAHHEHELASIFTADTTLVPAPRSTPIKEGWLWPGDRIAQALLAGGLGADVEHLLERTRAVPKAAFSAGAGDRPTIKTHMDTLAVRTSLYIPMRVVIVDDVITRGTMSYACAELLRKEFPEIDVAVFALLRTMSGRAEIDSHIDPYVGTIIRNDGSSYPNRSDYLGR